VTRTCKHRHREQQTGRIVVTEFARWTGKRLFGATRHLRLVDSTTVGDGVAILIYQPADRDPKGSNSNSRG
jgi:hypothetical protein